MITTRSAAAALLLAVLLPAQAQTYPVKPVRAIIPYGAGAPSDVIARAISPLIQQTFGQVLVVENRPGANGIIGTEACARAAPDGYSVCFISHIQALINPLVYAKLPYDPQRDLVPVIQVGLINNALAVGASVPVNSLRELIDLAKAKPGALNWASWGVGSTSHLYLAWLENRTGAKFNHVPYKEPAQALKAFLAGETEVIINTTGLLRAHVNAGKVKALSASGTKRSTFLPQVPTYKELGMDLELGGWIGVFGPAGMPRAAVQRLNSEIDKLFADKKFVEKPILALGLEPAGGSPEAFAAFIKTDREASIEIVRLAGVKPQ